MPDPNGKLINVISQLIQIHRFTDQEALAFEAFQFLKKFKLILRFDAFGAPLNIPPQCRQSGLL